MTTFRTSPQKAKLHAIFDAPPVVFACQINQAFSSVDKVTQFGFDTVTTGAYTAILPGMTLLLGSSAGAFDVGISYCRKAATASILYCGESSDIAFADNLYVTVLQDWAVWVETLTVLDSGVQFMRYDLAYTNQHAAMDPVPVLGPDRVVKYPGSAVTVSFDGSGSYVFDSTISSHLFVCTGATITGGSTATPTLTFSAPGRYLVAYTVTSAAGAARSTYRTVHVWDPSGVSGPVVTDVLLSNITGSYDHGGHDFNLTVSGDASGIRPRSKVILFAEEWYGDTEISYGPCAGAEKIVAIGWVGDEKTAIDVLQGQTVFEVHGAQYWLGGTYNFIPVSLIMVSGTPASWLEMSTLNADRALWHMVLWRSTLAYCLDLILSGDTRSCLEFRAPAGTLWDQLKALSFNYILATPGCDPYSRLSIQIDPALEPAASRSGIPVTASLTHDDWESVEVDTLPVPATSQVLLSGVVSTGTYANPTNTVLYSMAPGHVPGHYGNPTTVDKLLLSSQAQANELAGNVLEKARLPYRFILQKMLFNNRQIGVFPRQFISVAILAGDNLRGISYTGNAILRSLEWSFEGDSWTANLTADIVTQAKLDMNGDIPVATSQNPDGSFNFSTFKFPKLPPLPGFGGGGFTPPPPSPIPVTITPSACDDSHAVNSVLNWDHANLVATSGQNVAIAWNPCVVRNGTYIDIAWIGFNGPTPPTFHVSAIDRSGADIVTGSVVIHDGVYGTWSQVWIRASFAPVSNVAVAGFKLLVDPGMVVVSPLPLSQDNRGDTNGWDAVLSGSGSVVTTLDACARTVYDPLNGHVAYSIRMAGYSTHWLFGVEFGFTCNWVPGSIDIGTLWMQYYWSTTSSDPTKNVNRLYQDAGLYRFIDVVTGSDAGSGIFQVHYDVSTVVGEGPKNVLLRVTTPNGVQNVVYDTTLIVDFYWSGSTLPQKITLVPGDLYNVCPAT